MIQLDVVSLLEKNGKTKYWLYKQLGMSYQNFSRMIHNETKSIRYRISKLLWFSSPPPPNDLLSAITDERAVNRLFYLPFTNGPQSWESKKLTFFPGKDCFAFSFRIPNSELVQKSALPVVRGCSSTSRMFDTPVRYMTMRSKPRP